MLAAFCTTKEDNSNCAKLLGLTGQHHEGGLISDNTSLISSALANGGIDTCSFYSGPSDATIVAFGESAESCGSIAYSGSAESCGSIAYSGGAESCGSIASSSCGSSTGGCCSYSC